MVGHPDGDRIIYCLKMIKTITLRPKLSIRSKPGSHFRPLTNRSFGIQLFRHIRATDQMSLNSPIGQIIKQRPERLLTCAYDDIVYSQNLALGDLAV